MEETTTVIDKPISPYSFPSNTISNRREPMLTRAEYPTLVDSFAYIFVLIIKEIEIGIIVITKI